MTGQMLRMGISRCLLGDEVRFDGGHKHDHFLTDVLGRYVEWVPVCPEVEAGLGTPREAMRLVGDPARPQLITVKSGIDHTEALERMSANRLQNLKRLSLSGYVFKKEHRAAASNVCGCTTDLACRAGRESGSSRGPL